MQVMPFKKGHKAMGKPFKSGESGNPKGKSVGTKDYKTLAHEAIIKIAKAKNMKPEELDSLIYQSGILNAMEDFRYWNSHLDRIHGKAPQPFGSFDDDGEFIEGITVNLIRSNGVRKLRDTRSV